MTCQDIRRQASRFFLLVHFLGLALSLGAAFANVAIERQTRGGSLELLAFGRDLITFSSSVLVPTGFWMMVISGILVVVLRYGYRAPLWVWLKLTASVAIFAVADFAQGPVTRALAMLAHWSVEHGQLAPQYQETLALAGRYGLLTLALFLMTMGIAIWKPVSFRLGARRAVRQAQPSEAG
jgi:hypothetical protein